MFLLFRQASVISNLELQENNDQKAVLVKNTQLKIATFNLFNYLEPPNAFYEFERIYSAEQWAKKQRWIVDYLTEYQPDVIGFQEVFSVGALKKLVQKHGYAHFAVIDEPQVIDDFIYKRPVVAIASRSPISEVTAVSHDHELAGILGLAAEFSFSRKVLRATIALPHIGDTDCYVVHFKSKRSMIEIAEDKAATPEKNVIEHLKADIAGGFASTIQRGSEATLLMIEIIARREASQNPMVLMGDFNNTLNDGVLSHLITDSLRFVSAFDCNAYLAKYCLNDAWDLFVKSQINKDQEGDSTEPTATLLRTPTHYFGAGSSVLDYILLSCEFDASYHDSFYEITDYHTYDRHLINPEFERDDQSTDHGVVMITLTLRS